MIPVAILAGGLATRMRPHTETLPKSLLEVAGQPFLAYQLHALSRQGIQQVVLCVGHLAEQIEEFAGDGSAFGLQVTYSKEEGPLLGTGGALRKALPLLGEAFFVLYGDSWLEIDYPAVLKVFKKSTLPALMTVFRNEGHWDTSNVELQAGQIQLYSKVQRNERMSHIDYGLGILTRALLEAYPEQQTFDLAEVYEQLSRQHRLASYEATQRFYEIGSPSGLEELNLKLRNEI
ncbi:MAG: nucleotidyltransferase family protein [Deltaproteobacteria bacterium]